MRSGRPTSSRCCRPSPADDTQPMSESAATRAAMMSAVRHSDQEDVEERPSPGALTVVSGLAAGAAVALGTYGGALPLALALIACGVAVAWGWPILLDLPRPPGSSAVLLAGLVGIGVVELLAPRSHGLRWLTTALAIGLMVAFLHELLRSDGRRSLTLSIAGAVFGLAVLAVGAFHLSTLVEFDAKFVTYAACLGVAVDVVVDFFLGGRTLGEWSLPISLLLAVAAGAALGVLSETPWNAPMLSALAACGIAHALRRVVGSLPRASEAPAAVALGAGSVLVVGIVPFAVVWALTR